MLNKQQIEYHFNQIKIIEEKWVEITKQCPGFEKKDSPCDNCVAISQIAFDKEALYYINKNNISDDEAEQIIKRKQKELDHKVIDQIISETQQ